jgi:Common central domain of tyrosinase
MLGDGIRRDLATVSKEERDLLRDAILQLNQVFYSPGGSRTDFPAGNVSYWFKQDEIHQSSHVHGCPAFLPWHRDLCNRFEALLRTIDPRLSLHYWNWNLDPSNMPDGQGGTINLFDAEFMGNADGTVDPIAGFPFGGAVGQPLLGGGFYDPAAANFRDNNSPVQLVRPTPTDPSTFSYPDPASGVHYNPTDPPQMLSRAKAAGAPQVGGAGQGWATDADFINAPSWEAFRDLMYGDEQGTSMVGAHGAAHTYIGGNLSDPHLSFRDPFVFFLHSNIDRLWAMWQRQQGFAAQRLDPAQVYDTEENSTIVAGKDNVEVGEPYWGIQLPLAPWAGFAAQTQMTHVWPVRPWAPAPAGQPPEDEENLPGNNQISTDITIVIPPSYDTAPHSSYIVANQDIFSSAQAAVNLTFASAINVVYEGFQPREVGAPGAAMPSFAFTIAGVATSKITAVNPRVLLEAPGGAADMPQRILIMYDIVFADTSVFPTAIGAQTAVAMAVTLTYTAGGTGVAASDQSAATLLLVKQPSPYMVDIDPTIPPPGPPNPYWLSTDTRVFRVKQGAPPIAGITQGADPYGFITGLVGAFNARPSDANHPFLTQLSQDENASQLELSPTSGGTPVFNYAVAKIRYRGNVPATNVSAFFRAFKTMVSSLDYDHTGGPTGNYRRSGDVAGAVPLLGIESGEIASIPFFAKGRVNTATQSMTTQSDDPINTQISFAGTGQDEVVYCGVWLDINDINNPRFPIDPSTDPGGVNGPYQNPLFTIQQLVTGLHYCLVAEIFFWPPGTVTDPIPVGASPCSSDRLAQRNLSFDSSGNPGWPSTHVAQHTFMVKPSSPPAGKVIDAAVNRETVIGPDELIIAWGNVPRASAATLFFPEVSADEILLLSALRQHPTALVKVDAHTVSVAVSDVTFVPLPVRPAGNLAGLLTVTLPHGVRAGQAFKMNVQQASGIAVPRRARRMLGAFQFNISVSPDADLLPQATRTLSILRFIQQTIPGASRWHPIFTRWLNGLAGKVSGLGGDPTKVLPSPTGGDGPPPCPEPEPCEVKPRDLWCMNIPWDECDVEGEIELKLRFRKKAR